jgi:hypothetical protein
VNALGFGQPLLVVLVKLALLDALIEFDVVCFPQNGQHLVVDLSDSLIWIFNQLENAHEHFALIENAL